MMRKIQDINKQFMDLISIDEIKKIQPGKLIKSNKKLIVRNVDDDQLVALKQGTTMVLLSIDEDPTVFADDVLGRYKLLDLKLLLGSSIYRVTMRMRFVSNEGYMLANYLEEVNY